MQHIRLYVYFDVSLLKEIFDVLKSSRGLSVQFSYMNLTEESGVQSLPIKPPTCHWKPPEVLRWSNVSVDLIKSFPHAIEEQDIVMTDLILYNGDDGRELVVSDADNAKVIAMAG